MQNFAIPSTSQIFPSLALILSYAYYLVIDIRIGFLVMLIYGHDKIHVLTISHVKIFQYGEIVYMVIAKALSNPLSCWMKLLCAHSYNTLFPNLTKLVASLEVLPYSFIMSSDLLDYNSKVIKISFINHLISVSFSFFPSPVPCYSCNTQALSHCYCEKVIWQ